MLLNFVCWTSLLVLTYLMTPLGFHPCHSQSGDNFASSLPWITPLLHFCCGFAYICLKIFFWFLFISSLEHWWHNFKNNLKIHKQWKRYLCSWTERINFVQMPTLFKVIYRFNIICIKIPIAFLQKRRGKLGMVVHSCDPSI